MKRETDFDTIRRGINKTHFNPHRRAGQLEARLNQKNRREESCIFAFLSAPVAFGEYEWLAVAKKNGTMDGQRWTYLLSTLPDSSHGEKNHAEAFKS